MAAQTQSTTGPSFTDLPAELRNVIYQLALTHEKAIELTTWKRRGSPAIFIYAAKSGRVDAIALLRANRQIFTEATPVLYGGNTFYPLHEGAFSIWLRFIGASNRRHVRNMRFDRMDDLPKFQAGMKLLEDAARLQSIEIGHHFRWSTLERIHERLEWGEAFVPLLRKIQAQREQVGDGEPALDILRYWYSGGDCGPTEDARRKWREMRAAILEHGKEHLRKLLVDAAISGVFQRGPDLMGITADGSARKAFG